MTTSVVYVEPLNTASYNDSSRVVRFDTQCVLIPEFSSRRRPRVVTKSYSLPLWKRRPTATTPTITSDSENTDDASNAAITTPTVPPPLSSSPEETHVVIKVPIPSFVRRPSRSPSGRGYGHSPSTSPTIPLSPCLVYRAPSSSPSSHPSTSKSAAAPGPSSPSIRRTSLPNYHRRPDDQTVPLRACCPDCIRITEESLEKGSTWQEKFTKGARRRRSASLDSTTTSTSSNTLLSSSSSLAKSAGFVPASFDARMPPPTLAITVDEVDKRRKSQESIRSGSPSSSRFTSSSSSTTLVSTRMHDRDHLPSSTSYFHLEEDDYSTSPIQDHQDPSMTKRKASPIAEEDENELFPLPSPRRSPNSSRTPSTASGGSSPKELSPRTSPVPPSPNGSAACLHPSSAAVAGVLKSKAKRLSGGGLGSSSSEEVLSVPGISRKDTSSTLTPPQSGTSTPRAGGTMKPKPASLTLAFPIAQPNNRSSSSNTNNGDTTPETPAMVLSSSFTSTSSASSFSFNGITSPNPTTTNTGPSHNTTTTSSNGQPKSPITPTSPRSPTLSNHGTSNSNTKPGRKLSFTLPFLKATEAIRGAGVDVLKGVSSMSGGGSMMGGGM